MDEGKKGRENEIGVRKLEKEEEEEREEGGDSLAEYKG